MAANLKGRLSRLRASGKERSWADSGGARAEARAIDAAGELLAPGPSKPGFLELWDEAADFVWTRTLSYANPLPASIDPAPFAPLRRTGAPASAAPVSRIASERLRFFDLETTGLSGGTGTIAFLASIGRVDEEGIFSISQVFLEDFPGEAAFIGIVLGHLGEDSVVASYNGKAFDLPLLRTRCVMTGFPPPSYAQLDALFAARRLWRRLLGEASLGAVESGALGIERGPDIPGAMIPELWLSFAKDRAAGAAQGSPLMPLVLSHNASDVASLAAIVARVAEVFESPLDYAERDDIDRAGLGRGLLAIGRAAEGEALLGAAARGGDGRAALRLFRRLRLGGRSGEAIAAAAFLPPGYPAAVELAKLYERGSLDLPEAAFWAKEAIGYVRSEGERDDAERRLARIERKLGREKA
jgi:uncharacterized protein